MHLHKFFALGLAQIIAVQGQSLTEALASQNSSLSVLNGLLQTQPNIVETLSRAQNITILAPSNDALQRLLNNTQFAARIAQDPSLLAGILQYHVLNGTYYGSSFTNMSQFIPTLLSNPQFANVTGGQRVEAIVQNDKVVFYSALKENSTVTSANVNFTAGTIHIIDRVLSVPASISSTLLDANLTATLGAVRAAGVGPALQSLSDLTIFAPNNNAFNNIGNITANITTDQLRTILQYHVVPGVVGYSSMLGNMSLQTAAGGNVTIRSINGSIYVNSAKVVIPNVLVSNGVVHVIDNVLNPQNSAVTPDPSASTQGPAFPGAGTATTGGIPFTSGGPTPTTTPPVATTAGPGGVRSTTTSAQLAPAMRTGVMGAAALFGGAAVAFNL